MNLEDKVFIKEKMKMKMIIHMNQMVHMKFIQKEVMKMKVMKMKFLNKVVHSFYYYYGCILEMITMFVVNRSSESLKISTHSLIG